MAPYNPPVSHYTQMDVSDFKEDFLYSFIGKSGRRFYWLTRLLGIDYLWYDNERKVIEIWGPYNMLETNQSEHIIRCELENFIPKSPSEKEFSAQDAQTPSPPPETASDC